MKSIKIVKFFANSWKWIVSISVAVPVITYVLSFLKKFENSRLKTVLLVLAIIIIVFTIICCIIATATDGQINQNFCSKKNKKIFNLPINSNKTEKRAVLLGKSSNGRSLYKHNDKLLVFNSDNELEAELGTNVTEEWLHMPKLVGMEQKEATNLLISMNLQFKLWWSEDNNENSEKSYVKTQSIKPGLKVPQETIVKLELSPNEPQ